MASQASILKHPIHPMLIPFPIALWIFSFVCDVIRHGGMPTFAQSIPIHVVDGKLVKNILMAQ